MLKSSDVVKDLGIYIHEKLSSEKRLAHRVKKKPTVFSICLSLMFPHENCNKFQSLSLQVIDFFSTSLHCIHKNRFNCDQKMSKKVRKMNSWSPNQLRNSIKTEKFSSSPYLSATTERYFAARKTGI